jgi:hypothetical protein
MTQQDRFSAGPTTHPFIGGSLPPLPCIVDSRLWELRMRVAVAHYCWPKPRFVRNVPLESTKPWFVIHCQHGMTGCVALCHRIAFRNNHLAADVAIAQHLMELPT